MPAKNPPPEPPTLNALLAQSLERVTAALRSSLERFERDPQGDALHDLRVALRRTAALAGLFRDYPSEGEGRGIKRAAQRARRALSAARQREVSRELLAAMDERAPDLLPATPALPPEELAATRPRVDELVDALGGWARRNREARSRVVSGFPAELAKRLEKARVRVLELGLPERKTLHPLRIAGKTLRYRLEILVPVEPAAEDLVAASRKLQDALGAAHDWECLAEDLHAVGAGDVPLAIETELRVRRAATLARARREGAKFARLLEDARFTGVLKADKPRRQRVAKATTAPRVAAAPRERKDRRSSR